MANEISSIHKIGLNLTKRLLSLKGSRKKLKEFEMPLHLSRSQLGEKESLSSRGKARNLPKGIQPSEQALVHWGRSLSGSKSILSRLKSIWTCGSKWRKEHLHSFELNLKDKSFRFHSTNSLGLALLSIASPLLILCSYLALLLIKAFFFLLVKDSLH